jgi:hypothetical protein
MARVYLETSFVSACVTARQTSRAIYEREMSLAWLEAEQSNNELLIADPVIVELSAPTYRDRDQALDLAAQFELQPITTAMEAFAIILADRFVMPQNCKEMLFMWQWRCYYVLICCLLGMSSTWPMKTSNLIFEQCALRTAL